MTGRHEREEIAERIWEAANTLRRLPDGDRGRLRMQAMSWPALLRDASEHGAYKSVQVKLPAPGGAQIDRMHEVLEWLLWLAKVEQKFLKAVWLCCGERRNVVEAAKHLAVHRETVAAWRDNGLDRIAAHARDRRAA